MMKLFEPGQIGKLPLKNRIVLAPMGIGSLIERDGRLSQGAIDYFTSIAKGGTGLIITGGARVTERIERSPKVPSHLAVADDMHIAGLSKLAEAVHDYGAKIAVQIRAGIGRLLYTTLVERLQPVAPSPIPSFWNPHVMTRELTTEEVEQLVKDFELAAKRVRVAGADAVEIEAHSGYLMDQFMTALWNKRTDKYGGSLEGRLRYPIEVIEAIKRGAGANFPIIFRYSPKHYFDGGREIEEALEIARRLEAAGVDAFHTDAGSYEAPYWCFPPTTQPPGCIVDLAERVKGAVRVPVIAVGRLGYPDLAERVLQEGKADFIALGRALVADPEWPNKVKEGKPEEIIPCLSCHEGCLKNIFAHKPIRCAVNPVTGREREAVITPAAKRKTVLVIGGGPAGMEAAIVAAQRGHQVTLWEKGNVLGGNLIPASVPDFKHDYRSLIDYLSTQVRKKGINVKLGKEGAAELIQGADPEVVIVATGARPIIPEIPGIEKEIVVTAIDVLLGKKDVGESVIVIGGGLIGCETALFLAQKGKKATVIARHEVADDMVWPNRAHLLKLLADAKVDVLSNTGILEVVDGGVIVQDQDNRRKTLEGDHIVLAAGLMPDRKLLEALNQCAAEIYAIGDCTEPGMVLNAIWSGFDTAMKI